MNKCISLAMAMMIVAGTQATGVTRQESTRQLKKVVYSGSCASSPQAVRDLGSVKVYYAKVSIPEINLSQMPTVAVYLKSGSIWLPLAQPSHKFIPGCYVTDGAPFVGWRIIYSSDGREEIQGSDFKVVVIYESGISVEVSNPDTGTSLDLNMHTDAETAKRIHGYKVLRRERPPEEE